MHHAPARLQIQGRVLGTLRDEARDRLRHHAPLLRPCLSLDQHVQVELLGCQSFRSVLADGAEVAFVDILQESFFQVIITQLAGVEVAQHALDVSRWQHLSDHVEHRVIVERVADLLQLVQQPLQHPSLDCVGGHEAEDQAVQPLPVAVDAAHALFEAIRVPRDVVVEQDGAALQVDALSGRFGGHQHLDRALAELLLGVEPGARIVPRAGLHPAVDAADPEAPCLQPLHQVVERVLEFGEDQQPLVGPVEEALILHEPPEMG